MALNLDELMIGDIILNDEGKPCIVEGLYRNQIYTNKGVYLPFEVDSMPLTEGFLLANGFCITYRSDLGDLEFRKDLPSGHIFIGYDNTVANYPGLYPWNFVVYNDGIGEFNTTDLAPCYLYHVHDLQHAIKLVNLNITLSCQQSS